MKYEIEVDDGIIPEGHIPVRLQKQTTLQPDGQVTTWVLQVQPVPDPSQEDKVQDLIDTALSQVHDLGYGVVADGTLFGNGVWLNKLRVIPTYHKEPKDDC